ncbi:MAG TPA: dihydrolipoamide acetyltransferase family protein [Woeseiaceae bacterium]|nr:dihydrolipoamide acetyltransferase family protein [Woeseiaceae bacterium]
MSEYIFKLPDLAEGTTEAEIGEWNVKVGDQVAEDDVVCTMMTEKAAVEVSSPVSGKVTKVAGEPGDLVQVGTPLIVFETKDDVGGPSGPTDDEEKGIGAKAPPTGGTSDQAREPDASPKHVGGPSGPTQQPGSPKPARKGKVITSPAIRRRAKEAGIDLTEVEGSGPRGRILREDFDRHLEQRSAGAPSAPPRRATGATEVKIIGLRRVIAERMAKAKQEIPHFAYVEELDVTELEALRKHLNGKKSDPAERLTLLPFIGLALIRALADFPQCNTTHDAERKVLLRHNPVHLGVATQTADGLKVPVVRHAEARDLDDLAGEIRRVTEAARDKSAKPDELKGSTITVTSLGRLGGIVSTPVINQPEVAIIGVNKAVQRPVIVDGQVTARLMMNLSSSFDHRFVDGYDAAAMIQRMKELLEHPATLFI